MRETLLAFGANVPGAWGSPAEAIARAWCELEALGVRVVRTSGLYETDPVGPVPQPVFLNAAALAQTVLEARQLLAVLKGLERQAGRVAAERWGPRPLDIDVLDLAGTVLGWSEGRPALEGGDLVLPHPELHRRAFVLVPLAEIAPHWRHPVLGLTAAEMLAGLPEGTAGIRTARS